MSGGSTERPKATIQCLIVRGLSLCSNRTKVDSIRDMLEINNSLGIGLTETWLSKDIDDAEIQIEDISVFRADRKQRSRGGAAVYLKSDLLCKSVLSYSNGVREAVLVKCKKLDVVFGVIYRPPPYFSG